MILCATRSYYAVTFFSAPGALHFALCSSERENISCLFKNWKLSVIFGTLTILFQIFFAGLLLFHFIHGDVDALLVPILFSLAQFHASLGYFSLKINTFSTLMKLHCQFC